MDEQPQQAESFIKKFWTRKIAFGLVGLTLAIVVGLLALSGHLHNKELARDQANQIQSQNTKTTDKKTKEQSNIPYANIPGIAACPSDLSGILTSSFIETKYVTYIDPLGAVNPPDHAEPVDHNYFQWETDAKIRLFAPADAWITEAMAGYVKNETGQYDIAGYTFTFAICKGASIILTSYVDVSQSLKDELKKFEPDCTYDIKKHEGVTEGACTYNNLAIKVKSGEELGWTQRQKRADGTYVSPFEVWAYNYNQEPRKDVNWDPYYQNYRYATCLFDWYRDPIKSEYYSKLGWNGKFRTVKPVCGQINQDIAGTLQGAWFNGADKNNSEAAVNSVFFIHDHIDPTKGEITTTGLFTSGKPDLFLFAPRNSGAIDREPSQVTADGKVYCYNAAGERGFRGKILTQLLDTTHMKIESQPGTCTANESFKNPFTYER